jgi:microcystin-dependent protein
MASPFLGEIRPVSFNFAPRGWAFCNGQILSIQQNTALFSLLGTTYGGDGVTTFALPDLRGRVPISAGQGPGLSPYTEGETAGVETVTLQVNQLPAHTHAIKIANPSTSTSPAGLYPAVTSRLIYNSTPDVFLNPASVGFTGGSQPHNNRQPYLAISFIIALQGIFPSRN